MSLSKDPSLFEMKTIIADNVKNFLGRDDYIDILKIVKRNNGSGVSESSEGTYIDLDKLDKKIIKEIYNLIKNRAKFANEDFE